MPYSDLDNEYAIMFQVGNGIPPKIPDEILKAEGKGFLMHCFQPQPDQRWTTSQLLEHSFVKVLAAYSYSIIVFNLHQNTSSCELKIGDQGLHNM